MNARSASLIAFATITMCFLSGCAVDKMKNVESSAAAAKDSLNMELGPARRLRIARNMVTQIDSLSATIKTDKRRDRLRAERDYFALQVRRCHAICASESLLNQVTLTVGPAAKTGGADSAQTFVPRLGALLQRLRIQDQVLREYLADHPQDAETSRLRALADSIAQGKDSLCLAGMLYVAIDVIVLSALGDALCSAVENVWSDAIKSSSGPYSMAPSFSTQIGVFLSKIESSQKTTMDKRDEEPQEYLVMFDPGQGIAQEAYEEATQWYLSGKELLNLGRNPRGSLLSYRTDHNRLLSESGAHSQRFLLELRKAALALGRQEIAASFRSRVTGE